ncbi:MAG: hypothetical protein N3E52_04110 [Candidatus Bathyarchaeota archaeon]|nr:hypothetical protein [Candidatus Bathyarchaeota archaeon]
MQATIRRLRLFKRGKRGISTVIVVMLSLVLIVVIVGNVVLWNYQMNQLDMERIQETITIANVTRATASMWYTAKDEYILNTGTRLSGTYGDTISIDASYETFREETALTNGTFNPSGYILSGSTRHVSGDVSDIATNNSAYMVFRSYPSAFTAQAVYSHSETITIAGLTYYQLKLGSADSSGISFQADASTQGRKLLAKYIYPLTGITTVPASTWRIFYRGYKGHHNVEAFFNVDIFIRKADGSIRATIATQVANSTPLTTSWATTSGTYSWNIYNVIDETDYIEVDYYVVVTQSLSNKYVYFRVDDPSLPLADQSRITGMLLPSTYTVQVELTGSSDTQNWQSLTWSINSAFTTTNVNITLQLYNYDANQYPTNGDGYISYISSSTPNTDETKSQFIVANPTYYRNLMGAWKIRITGVKDTVAPFNLKLDFVEFKTSLGGTYRFNITNMYSIDLQSCPIDCIHGLEILLRYKVSNDAERWFLKVYNWATSCFSDTGFNNTGGSQPNLNQWNDYAISITRAWTDYLSENSTILIELVDEGVGTSQTMVEIDFFAVRAIIDGTRLDLRNPSSLSVRVLAIWIINSTIHTRYNANLLLNTGEAITYIRADIKMLQDTYLVKVITERGNVAVFSVG